MQSIFKRKCYKTNGFEAIPIAKRRNFNTTLYIVEGGAFSSEMLVFPMFRRYPHGIHQTVDAEYDKE